MTLSWQILKFLRKICLGMRAVRDAEASRTPRQACGPLMGRYLGEKRQTRRDRGFVSLSRPTGKRETPVRARLPRTLGHGGKLAPKYLPMRGSWTGASPVSTAASQVQEGILYLERGRKVGGTMVGEGYSSRWEAGGAARGTTRHPTFCHYCFFFEELGGCCELAISRILR
jgi:hypothetical protein